MKTKYKIGDRVWFNHNPLEADTEWTEGVVCECEPDSYLIEYFYEGGVDNYVNSSPHFMALIMTESDLDGMVAL